MALSVYSVVFAACVVFVLNVVIKTQLQRRKMPPGPPGIPLLGNALQLPSAFPWLKFTEWSKQYGPIYSLNLAGTPVVILNTFKTAADLMDRRSNIYSDRPRLIMASEILTGGIFMIFTKYGDVWRKMRRASHEEFSIRGCEKFQGQQHEEAALSVLDILETPDEWQDCLKRSTASNILTAVYGRERLTPKDKPLITRIHAHTARIAGAVVPGAYLVEIFPFMKHFPTWMAKWKKDGLDWYKRETDMFEKLCDDIDTQKHSFVRGLKENQARHGLTKPEAAWLAGIMFSAGAETTLGTLFNFVLAMTLYPNVMKRAQAEIDSVVGRDRLPNFDDKPRLPYIRAMVKESLRWRPVGPVAVPRRTTEDDYYNGYLIPKGTTVIPNIWAMNHDPELYPDFEEFRPDRFLDESGQKDNVPPDTHEMGHGTFGFGRRICVGYNFANQVLFIQMAMMLWAFNFEAPLDDSGKPIVPDRSATIDAGVVVLPAPFKTKITPRSPDVPSTIRQELEHLGAL